jgi:hypothetical protein
MSDDHKHNGMITKIWGSPAWFFNHMVTFGYPIEPSDEQKKHYKDYFISLGNVLPCRYCRESYQKFISSGDTMLLDADLESRETLTKWFFRVHNVVNNKLDVDYGTTYEDLCERFESFRAKCDINADKEKGCVIALNYKAQSYKNMNLIEPPLIALEMVKKFIPLCESRGIKSKYMIFYDEAVRVNGDVSVLRKKTNLWNLRTSFCRKKIQKMRESIIKQLDDEGMPTNDELKLILFMSSTLCDSELKNIIKKI